jgi:hypothetical protein
MEWNTSIEQKPEVCDERSLMSTVTVFVEREGLVSNHSKRHALASPTFCYSLVITGGIRMNTMNCVCMYL